MASAAAKTLSYAGGCTPRIVSSRTSMLTRTAALVPLLETVDVVSDFLETAIHMILYIRELYPPHLFERQKKYNVPVHVARHPELVAYVKDMIRACRPDLEKGAVERICLVVVNKAYTPVERFVFEIDALIDPKSADKDTAAEDGLTAVDVEAYLRAFLLKISLCDAVLHPNPPDCTFALVLQLNDGTPSATQNGFPWVPDDQPKDALCPDQSAKLIPIKSMDTGLMKVASHAGQSTAYPANHGPAR
ncbi:DNA-binding protein [Syncephalis pseudoplumigaleata]|uniref:DNA-binding protein n=1 Tax=Syncephalis pseudoplumigaleata TaxID=1712513 RepID=A0A4P9YY83_9FUNG|nr:DNA-binding protein [Syncephalis pseudoplumigaleata]|eukprot:RKP24512.1 DNA-binding protein [Syncephalis pseudoplumigaleata]